MGSRWNNPKLTNDTVIIRWETSAAEYLQIEISPMHLFRIKVDKNVKEKGHKI